MLQQHLNPRNHFCRAHGCDDMQFGFMKGKGTTDAIFMARQMQENFRVKGKKLYFGFVDLEKAFDSDKLGNA